MPKTSAPTSALDAALPKALPQGGELHLDQTGPSAFAFRSLRVGDVRVFDLDLALPYIAPLLAKADTSVPIPDGARWITVHPNGDGSKGVPVLVQEEKKGAGIWHVIAGAGGSLNYLKVRGVKSEAAYKQEAAERAGAKKAEKKAQQARDAASGLTGDKRQAQEALTTQVRAAEKEFVKRVAEAQGWDASLLTPNPPPGLTDSAPEKFVKDHARGLLRQATKAVGLQRQALLLDGDLRAASLGAGGHLLERRCQVEHGLRRRTVADQPDV
jgi:hypothetical protein